MSLVDVFSIMHITHLFYPILGKHDDMSFTKTVSLLFLLQRRKTLCCGRCVWTHVTCSLSLTTCCTSSTQKSYMSLRRSQLPRTSWTVCLRLQEWRARRPARRCWTPFTATCLICCSRGKEKDATWMRMGLRSERNVSVWLRQINLGLICDWMKCDSSCHMVWAVCCR